MAGDPHICMATAQSPGVGQHSPVHRSPQPSWSFFLTPKLLAVFYWPDGAAIVSSYTWLTFLTDIRFGALFEFAVRRFSPLTSQWAV